MHTPYSFNQILYPMQHSQHHLKHTVLQSVEPFVQYGLKEAQVTSYLHAMREVSAITYLIGLGYEPRDAYRIVESWEINESFYPPQR